VDEEVEGFSDFLSRENPVLKQKMFVRDYRAYGMD